MSYEPYESQQQMLLREALQDWVPEGHLAYFVGDAIYGLNLSAFHARCEAGGSSNQLHENGQGQCRAPQAMNYGYMVKAEGELKAQIAAVFVRAKSTDEAERNEPELDIPAEIVRRQDRLDAIAQARARLERRQREAELERGRDPDDKPRGGRYKREFGAPEDKTQDNFTDPDSRIMKRAGGGHRCRSKCWPIRVTARSACSRYRPTAALSWSSHWIEKTSRNCASIRSATRARRRWRPCLQRTGQCGISKAQVDRRAARWMDQDRAWVPPVQLARPASRRGRMEARVPGLEPAKKVHPAGRLRSASPHTRALLAPSTASPSSLA